MGEAPKTIEEKRAQDELIFKALRKVKAAAGAVKKQEAILSSKRADRLAAVREAREVGATIDLIADAASVTRDGVKKWLA